MTGRGYCGRLGIDDLLRSTSQSGPGGTASEKPPLIVGEMPANSGLLRIGYRSPGSVFGPLSPRKRRKSLGACRNRDRRPVRSQPALSAILLSAIRSVRFWVSERPDRLMNAFGGGGS